MREFPQYTGTAISSRTRWRRCRHGAEIIADKLADALDRWPNEWSGEERDWIGQLREHHRRG